MCSQMTASSAVHAAAGLYDRADPQKTGLLQALVWTVERIIATGRASLPYLGIVGGDVEGGVALQDVLAGGPAIGLLQPGDLITRVDGEPATSNAALAAALAERRPGEQVRIGVLRDGDPVEVPVILAERPPGGP